MCLPHLINDDSALKIISVKTYGIYSNMTNLTTKLYVMVILCRYGEWRQNGQWFPPYTQLGMVFALLEGICVSFYELRGQPYIKRRIGGHFLLIVWYYQCYRHTWPFPAEVFRFYCSQRLKLSSWSVPDEDYYRSTSCAPN